VDGFGRDNVLAVLCDVAKPDSVAKAFEEVVSRWGGLDILVNNAGLSFGGSVEETMPEDYDRLNDVMPRGSFLCSREAARIMRGQGRGGDIVYIVSKNAVYAGPKNVAYGSAKAAQLHQARLLAVELAEIGVRVNVVNPDAVVRDSGIFAGGWGTERARAYGVKEEDLGKYYARRTLLKQEILPEDVAAAVYVLVGPDLRKSTGLVINVDGGFPPAMMR
jgi:NAD(P)-dependent dehydrogenase (short-subunit alcohol dehydrogenase family)